MAIQSLHTLCGFLVVNGGPQLGALLRIGKPGWHNPDDGIGFGIQAYRLVQNRRIAAKAPFPQSPAQDDRPICGWPIVLRSETSSKYWPDSKCWEQLPGALRCVYLFWK